MTTWKSVERAIARIMGGRRVPVTGRGRGDAPDIEHYVFSLEVKHRKDLPDWLLEAMEQARAAQKDGQIPMVVLHKKNTKFERSLAVLELRDIISIVRKPEEK